MDSRLVSWRLSVTAAIVAALLCAPASALAQAQGKGKAQPKPAPEELTGLKVGEKAPAFTLKDQDGKERSLGEFLGKGKVALVFYRSADW